MNKKKKILVCYASTGSGHNIASLAIFEELEKLNLDATLKRVDIMDYFPGENVGDQFVSVTSGALSGVFDFSWRHNFTGRLLWGGGHLWPTFMYGQFENYIIDEDPDLVICTHQICSNTAAKARLKMDKYFPIVSVPTDYETEGLWPHKQSDIFCVASEEMANTLRARRVPENKILVSGLPVLSKYCKAYSQNKSKKELGLPLDKKIGLIIAGAKAPGPYKNIRKTLNEAFKYLAQMDWMHFVICVGEDGEYGKKLMNKANKYKANNISILTYTDNMPQLMEAADIAIIKPGGLATTECICSKLPILLVGKTFAQENINRRYLLACGVAEHATTYRGLVMLLCDIFMEDNRYETMLNNITKLRKTDAARKIAKASVKLMDKSFDEKKKYISVYIGKRPAHTR